MHFMHLFPTTNHVQQQLFLKQQQPHGNGLYPNKIIKTKTPTKMKRIMFNLSNCPVREDESNKNLEDATTSGMDKKKADENSLQATMPKTIFPYNPMLATLLNPWGRKLISESFLFRFMASAWEVCSILLM
jgi:hypothetical protein